MLYLQENIRQQALASIFGTSQPTISRAINTVLNILDVVLPPPPRPKDLMSQHTYLMARSCRAGGGKTPETLCSGKHHRAGHNLQVLTDQAGEIFYISKATTRINPWHHSYKKHWLIRLYATLALHCTADKGYVGLGCNTPFKKRPGKPLLGWQRRFNKGINQIRYVIERSIAHLKVWRILSIPCRLPQPTTIRAINVIRKIMFYQPPAEPCFPSSWISFCVVARNMPYLKR